MPYSTVGQLPTERPSRYLKQLCEHFSHKRNASYDEYAGFIEFDDGICQMRVEPGALVIEAIATAPEQSVRIAKVAARHLERFGLENSTNVGWTTGWHVS